MLSLVRVFFFFSSRRRHTRSLCDWSSDVCSSDLLPHALHSRLNPVRHPSELRISPVITNSPRQEQRGTILDRELAHPAPLVQTAQVSSSSYHNKYPAPIAKSRKNVRRVFATDAVFLYALPLATYHMGVRRIRGP